jgi:hypothetical protein
MLFDAQRCSMRKTHCYETPDKLAFGKRPNVVNLPVWGTCGVSVMSSIDRACFSPGMVVFVLGL